MLINENVFPLSCLYKFFTFSKKRTLGFFFFTILAISKNKVPLVSLNPPCFPETLNAWHGNPPHRISCSGISFSFILVISPKGISLKLYL